MNPNRSGGLNPQSFDCIEPPVVRAFLTLNRSGGLNPMQFFGWITNLHPGALLYCSTLLNKALYLLPGFSGWRK